MLFVISVEQAAPHLVTFVCSAGAAGSLLRANSPTGVWLPCAELMDLGNGTLCTSSAQGAPTWVPGRPSGQEVSV